MRGIPAGHLDQHLVEDASHVGGAPISARAWASCRVVDRAIVAGDRVLHEAHALALDRVGREPGGLSLLERQVLQGGVDLPDVVAVDLAIGPAAGANLVAQRLQVEHVLAESQGLDLVVVDDHGQVVEMVLGGQQDRLPGGAGVAVAVAHQAEIAVLPSGPLGGQGHAAGHRQPVAQRAGGELHARHVMADVAHQLAVVAIVGRSATRGERTPARPARRRPRRRRGPCSG